MNSVNFIGNIAADLTDRKRTVEVGGESKSVMSFPVAISGAGNDKDSPGYIDVTCWNGQAEAVSKYLAKGARIGVEGQLRQRSWEKDGVKNYRVEIANARITFLGTKSDEQPSAANVASEAPAPTPSDDDIPF